ncbi:MULTISPECIES: hypothetical protein [unclassified Streptomyces]|uniref:hypothetical protein n=1 Tax=unclassified Streptomyces TaxID=2593676 RepID=UPI0036EE59AA
MAITALSSIALALPQSVPAPAQAAPAAQKPGVSCAIPQEWSSCVHITTKLDRAPAVGESAQLTIEVASRIDVSDATVRADLPGALEWQSAPAGWKTKELGPLLPEDGTGVRRASRTVDLHKGQTLRYTATVRGTSAASTSVRAQVDGPSDQPVDVDTHMQLLSVGASRADSYLGLHQRRNSTALAPIPHDTELVPSAPNVKYRPVSTDGLPKPHSDDPPAADPSLQALSCATGTVGYADQGGVAHPSRNIQVQAWDDDTVGDDLLDVALTDGNGGFRLCFENGNDPGGQDLYLRVVAENGLARVVDEWFLGRDLYFFQSGQRDDIADGRTVDFGRVAPGDQALNRVLHAFAQADDAQAWTPGECWDARDTGDCRRMEIVYPDDDSNDNSRYTRDDDTVRLEPATPDDRTDAVHEYGHAVMDDIYDDDFWPNTENCSPHQMNQTSSVGCAWSEGFANFYPMAIYNEPLYRGWNVENTTDYQPGDATEGRVTGSLWDLMDPPGEAYWDDHQENATGAIWDTLLDRRSGTFREFWTHRGQEGHDVGPGPLGALFQNGIDYGFRNPLADGRALTRPTPEQQHNYRYDTSTVFWSVTAIRPPANVDYDLYMYDDPDLQQLLGLSLGTGDTIDFVAVDSAVRGMGDYYPAVRRPALEPGGGEYRIELSNPSRLLVSPATQTMNGNDDIVSVWDFCPGTPGGDVTLTATPSDSSQDAELFLMDSDPANPASGVVGRSGAAASSTSGGPGQPESLTFTPQGNCYGVVLVNRAGSGTYTLTRS